MRKLLSLDFISMANGFNGMMTSSNINSFCVTDFCEVNPPVTGGFPVQGFSNAGFGVSCHVSLNKQLSKRSICRFETPCHSCDVIVMDGFQRKWYLIWSAYAGCKLHPRQIIMCKREFCVILTRFIPIGNDHHGVWQLLCCVSFELGLTSISPPHIPMAGKFLIKFGN